MRCIVLISMREGLLAGFPSCNFVHLSEEGITFVGTQWTTSFGLRLLRVSYFRVLPPPRALLSKVLAMAGAPALSPCPFLLVLCVSFRS